MTTFTAQSKWLQADNNVITDSVLLLQRQNQYYRKDNKHVYNAAIGAAFIIVCMNPGADEEIIL